MIAIIVNDNEIWDVFSIIRMIRNLGLPRKVVLSKSIGKFLAVIKDSFLEDYTRAVTNDGLLSFEELMGLHNYIIYDYNKSSGFEALREIAKEPSKYILFLTRKDAFSTLEKVSVLSGHAGGCCVLSFSAGELDTKSTIRTFAKAIGHIGYCVEKTNALARGHVSPHHLAKILGIIEPDMVFVVHTLASGGLKSFLDSHLDCEVFAPSKGRQYSI